MQALFFFILCGLLPGAIIWISVSHKISLVETIVCGFVISQSLIAVGLVFSRNINTYSGRYVPLLMTGLLLPKVLRKLITHEVSISQAPKRFLIFPFISTAILLPQALNSSHASKLDRLGSLYLDTDIQFLLSLASESIHRIPSVYPHAADTHIAYTWLFSGVIGFWANMSHKETIRIMLFYWPVFFAVIFPLITFFIIHRITERIMPAIVGCLSIALFGGPKLPDALYWITASPTYLWSPHRDFATLLMLTLIISVLATSRESHGITKATVHASALFIITFTAIGSKGSVLLLLVGGGISSLLFNFPKNRRAMNSYLRLWIPIGSGALAAQLMVVRMSGYAHLSLPSAPFISGELANRPYLVLFFFGCVSLFCGIPITLLHNYRNLDRNVLSLLIGIPFIVIPGVLFVSHPGQSQLYFWQSAIPILLIAASIVMTEIIEKKKIYVGLIVATVIFVNQYVTWNLPLFIFISTQVVLVVITFSLVSTQSTNKQPSSRKKQLLSAAIFSPIALVSLIPIRTPPVGAWALKGDSSSINQKQIQSLHWMRANTPIGALIATNKH